MSEQPEPHALTGWCIQRNHQQCRPTTSQPGWKCGCNCHRSKETQ